MSSMLPTLIETNKLKIHPSNPRAIRNEKLEKLKKSITEDPELMNTRPLLVNEQMEVFAGNQRLRACIALGWKEVPCVVVDWDEAKQRRAMIKDNVSAGEWDWDMLANEWDETSLNEWGLFVPVVEDVELDEMPQLPEGDREPYQQMTFNVHDDQAKIIKEAISLARGALTRDEKYIFTKWLKEQGVKAKQINEATGSFMGSHYLTDKSQPDVPTLEKWEKFRHLVKAEVPQHIDDLINRHTIAEHQNDNANGNALCDICKTFVQEDERKRY